MIEARTREKHLEERGGNLYFLQSLLNECNICPATRILELGCGTGLLAYYLALITGAKVQGTEMSKGAFKLAQKRIRCHYTPNSKIPDNIGKFDMIYCKDVLPCNKDKGVFYRMILNHLDVKGVFVTYMPSEKDIRLKPLLNFIPQSIETTNSVYGTIIDNIQCMQRVGFKTFKSFPLHLGSIPMDRNYVCKHWDGYFSNTDSQEYEVERFEGLRHFQEVLDILGDEGIVPFYHWARTMIVAKK